MPISLDPQETRLFWLASDAGKPLATRPAFECIAPTRRAMRKYRALYADVQTISEEARKLREAADFKGAAHVNEGAYDKLAEMALVGVAGWRNFGENKFEPTADCLDGVLSSDELADLAYGWPSAFKMTESDAKNSLSPSQSDTGASAPDAVANGANTTSPTASISIVSSA